MIFGILKSHGTNSTRLDCEKIGEMVVETTKKGKHTKNNQFESRSFIDDRYP